jgi:hypothetical protein
VKLVVQPSRLHGGDESCRRDACTTTAVLAGMASAVRALVYGRSGCTMLRRV